LVLAGIAGLLFLFIYPDYRQGEPSMRGRPEKDFPLTLGGAPTSLAAFRGKIVVLNFWASWCQPCVQEAQSLNVLQQQLKPLGGTVLGVSLDEDGSAYDSFLKTYQIDFPTYRDPSTQIALNYGTTMYPETYIIDPKGRIDRKIIGPQDWTSPAMLAYFQSLAREN
jgi:cytochrome c biogenesis protein CcmG/thiol:disulfide interchange protein DsbE